MPKTGRSDFRALSPPARFRDLKKINKYIFWAWFFCRCFKAGHAAQVLAPPVAARGVLVVQPAGSALRLKAEIKAEIKGKEPGGKIQEGVRCARLGGNSL